MADWFIDFNAWFLWPASIWVLASSIILQAVLMIIIPKKILKSFTIEMRNTTQELAKGVHELKKNTTEVIAETAQLRKDNIQLKEQTTRLTNQLEENRQSIINLYTTLRRLHNFWFPYNNIGGEQSNE